MVLKADQERVRTLLTETITLLCKNGLHYQSEFSIEGLIAITVDSQEIFLVSLKETFHVPANKLKIKELDDSPQLIHSVQTKTMDSGKSPDSMEFCDTLQVHTPTSGRCTRRGRKSIPSIIDLPKKDLNNYVEHRDLDPISHTFMGSHCINDIPDIATTNREIIMHVEPYQTSFTHVKEDSELTHTEDLNNHSMADMNSISIENEDLAPDEKMKLSHIKREIDDEDVIGDCITVEPRMSEEMNDSLAPKYSINKLQRAAYHRTDAGIYQPSALRPTTTNLSMAKGSSKASGNRRTVLASSGRSRLHDKSDEKLALRRLKNAERQRRCRARKKERLKLVNMNLSDSN